MKRTLFYLMVGLTLLFLVGCSEKSTEANQTVATPRFNIPNGTYVGAQLIMITCQTEGAEIRYTLDGTEPAVTSELYTLPYIKVYESVIIKAKAFKEGWHASQVAVLNLSIEVLEVHLIEFDEISSTVELGEILTLRARALDIDQNPLPDGIMIIFEATKGFFVEFGAAPMENGWAAVDWNSGTSAGTALIIAKIGEIASEVSISILAGEPVTLNVSLEYQPDIDNWMPLLSNNIPDDFPFSIRIRASIRDTYNNPVSDREVLFETTIGIVEGSVTTNEYGIAYSIFNPGNIIGDGMITISVTGTDLSSTIPIHIYSSEVETMIFTEEGDINILTATPIRVELLNSSGNHVTDAYWVLFEIVGDNPPGGVSINNEGLSSVMLSNGGIAIASIARGAGVGQLSLKVSLVDNPAIFVQKDNIYITSGPPHQIQITTGGYNTGVNVGGGVWRIDASAYVTDMYDNPVLNGTEVQFYLGGIPLPPEDCYIETPAYTNDGLAETFLFYHGSYTFDDIIIIVESGNVTNQSLVTLPVNGPIVEIYVDAYLNFFPGDLTDSFIDLEIPVSLRDGQNNLITNGELQLMSSHGLFVYYEWFDNDGYPVNNPTTPEIITTYVGNAYGMLRIQLWEFPPPEEYFTTLDIALMANLLGTDYTVQTSFTIRIYNIPPPGS